MRHPQPRHPRTTGRPGRAGPGHVVATTGGQRGGGTVDGGRPRRTPSAVVERRSTTDEGQLPEPFVARFENREQLRYYDVAG